MRFPTTFTYLSFYFNSLIDQGEILKVDELKKTIEHGDLFAWLKGKFGDDLDVSLFSDAQLRSIQNLFLNQQGINERKKFGVENNGLCFLVAYCLNLIQYGEEEIKKTSPLLFGV